MTVGTTVKVFGKHLATVTAVASNGKRVLVSGLNYSGWTKLDNVKAVAS